MKLHEATTNLLNQIRILLKEYAFITRFHQLLSQIYKNNNRSNFICSFDYIVF